MIQPRFSVQLSLLFFFIVFPPLWAQTAYKPITFTDAAQMALDASEDLKNDYAQMALRQGAWVWGRRAYLPKLVLSAAEDDRLSQISTDSFQKTYTIGIDQLLWDGGRTTTARDIEKVELAVLAVELERKGRAIASAALQAYRSVLTARALLEIRESSWESLKEQRRILAEEVDRGLALKIDLVKADIAVSEALIAIMTLRIDLEESEQFLASALGLDSLPALAEKVDIYRSPVLPPVEAVRSLAYERHPDLVMSRQTIAKKQAEAHYSSLSWLPIFRLNAGLSLSGRDYPLTKSSWSVGLSIEFDSPWVSGSFSGSAGWDPPYDKTARTQASVTPVPNPAAGFTQKSAGVALILEREKYGDIIKRVDRNAAVVLDKCRLVNQRRELAVESIKLSREQLVLTELRLNLGLATRVDLMEARIELAGREAAAVEAAIAVIEAERELELFLDIIPGSLTDIAELGQKSFVD